MQEQNIVNNRFIQKDVISHDLVWTEEKINAFWDSISSSSNYDHSYFTYHIGEGIINLVRCFATLQGNILDFGCGIGHLTGHITKQGLECYCCDSSSQSINKLKKRLKNNTSLKGSFVISSDHRLPFENNNFDMIFCVEVFEHLKEGSLSIVIEGLRRILKKETGYLLVTTPYNENLTDNTSYCPDCGALFHRYQHLRSFTQESLSNLMTQAGFKTLYCNNTDFNQFQRPFIGNILDWPLRRWGSFAGRLLATCKDKIPWQKKPVAGFKAQRFFGRGEHLFWIGTVADPLK